MSFIVPQANLAARHKRCRNPAEAQVRGLIVAMWGLVVQNRDSSEWDFAPAAAAFARLRWFGLSLLTLLVVVLFLLISVFFVLAVIAVDLKSKAMAYWRKATS